MTVRINQASSSGHRLFYRLDKSNNLYCSLVTMTQESIRYGPRGTGVNVSQWQIAQIQQQIPPNACHVNCSTST